MEAKQNIQFVLDLLNQAFPGSLVKVNGKKQLDEHYQPDGHSGTHLKVEIHSGQFKDQPLIDQHKSIHTILEKHMQMNGGFIHALTIKTRLSE